MSSRAKPRLAIVLSRINFLRSMFVAPDQTRITEGQAMFFEIRRFFGLIPLKSLFQLNPILLLPDLRTRGEDSSELR